MLKTSRLIFVKNKVPFKGLNVFCTDFGQEVLIASSFKDEQIIDVICCHHFQRMSTVSSYYCYWSDVPKHILEKLIENCFNHCQKDVTKGYRDCIGNFDGDSMPWDKDMERKSQQRLL